MTDAADTTATADPIIMDAAATDQATETMTESLIMEDAVGLSIMLLIAAALVTLAAVGAVIFFVLRRRAAAQEKKHAKTGAGALLDKTNSVGVQDLAYLVKSLSPDSTHMDLLLTVCSTPENIEWSMQALAKAEEIRQERIEKKKLEKPKKEEAFDFGSMMDEGGWDEGEDEDEDEVAKAARLKAKQADLEKQAEMERLKQATGKAVVLLEGVDEGVLGQLWVEKTLQKAGAWPPKNMGMLKTAKFEYKGKMVSALDHPALRRNLCMTMGRINSQMLNTHSELLEAGAKKLIDNTYFRSSMEFRQRVGILLEAALRVGMTLRNYRLVSTIIETVSLFKVGCPSGSEKWFEEIMQKTYDCLPRVVVQSSSLGVAGETNIATGEQCDLTLELERTHAEKFLRQKIAMFQKQGIPPQVGLQSYREAWWIMLRVERLDGKGEVEKLNRENTVLSTMDAKDIEKFDKEDAAHRLVVAWPMMVQNIAQKTGKATIQVKAPKIAGKYRFHVGVKSQDFIGADQDITIDVVIVDASTVTRKEKKPAAVVEEQKKDK